jgi:hypothetical protein
MIDAAGTYMTIRWINKINTGQCFNCNVDQVHTNTEAPIIHGKYELESHADSCILGPNHIRTYRLIHKCLIFSNDLDINQNVPLVSVGTDYDNPNDDTTIILIIHQDIFYPWG